jgi:hypothetical protein
LVDFSQILFYSVIFVNLSIVFFTLDLRSGCICVKGNISKLHNAIIVHCVGKNIRPTVIVLGILTIIPSHCASKILQTQTTEQLPNNLAGTVRKYTNTIQQTFYTDLTVRKLKYGYVCWELLNKNWFTLIACFNWKYGVPFADNIMDVVDIISKPILRSCQNSQYKYETSLIISSCQTL